MSPLLTSNTFELRFPTAASENYSLMFLYKKKFSQRRGMWRGKARRENLLQTSKKIHETIRKVTEKSEGRENVKSFTWSQQALASSEREILTHCYKITSVPRFSRRILWLFCKKFIRGKIAWKIKIMIGWNKEKQNFVWCWSKLRHSLSCVEMSQGKKWQSETLQTS